MKLGILTIAGILLLSACGSNKENSSPSQNAVSSGIYGTWAGFEPVSNGDLKAVYKIRIENKSLTNIVTCTFPDSSTLVASVTAAAEITPSTIKALEEKEHTAERNGKKCSAKISRAEITYVLAGNKLTLQDRNNSVVLTRE